MTWGWVGAAAMVVVFIVCCIIAVAMFGALSILVIYTIKTIRDGIRTPTVDRSSVIPIMRNPE